MNSEKTVVMSCRVKQRFAELIKKYCDLDAHLNPADFIRDALREKIQKDAPEFYKLLFQEAKF